MYAQIDQRAAARARFVAKPAAGTTLAAQILRLRVVDFAKAAAVDKVFEHRAIVAKAAYKTDHQQLAALFRGLFHFLRLRRVERHGLFAQHVLARAQRGNGALRMRAVPGANAHRVQFLEREHLPVVRERARNLVFLRSLGKVLFVDIAQRVDFHVGVAAIAAQVYAGNAARADDANFDHGDLPFLKRLSRRLS